MGKRRLPRTAYFDLKTLCYYYSRRKKPKVNSDIVQVSKRLMDLRQTPSLVQWLSDTCYVIEFMLAPKLTMRHDDLWPFAERLKKRLALEGEQQIYEEFLRERTKMLASR